jgi:hypothetical protein
MSANTDVLHRSELIGSAAREKARPKVESVRQTNDWNPQDFAREQIRGLVRRVFFASGGERVKHVVFSAAEVHTDVADLCNRVGQALALETCSDIAIVERDDRVLEMAHHPPCVGKGAIKSWSTQLATNLWRVSEFRLCGDVEQSGSGIGSASRLAQLRKEFEYAVIQGPAAGISSEAALLGHLSDGLILVLDAQRTRRATACKIKETLEGADSRILGTVLSGRRFPVPEPIYRRL